MGVVGLAASAILYATILRRKDSNPTDFQLEEAEAGGCGLFPALVPHPPSTVTMPIAPITGMLTKHVSGVWRCIGACVLAREALTDSSAGHRCSPTSPSALLEESPAGTFTGESSASGERSPVAGGRAGGPRSVSRRGNKLTLARCAGTPCTYPRVSGRLCEPLAVVLTVAPAVVKRDAYCELAIG